MVNDVDRATRETMTMMLFVFQLLSEWRRRSKARSEPGLDAAAKGAKGIFVVYFFYAALAFLSFLPTI